MKPDAPMEFRGEFKPHPHPDARPAHLRAFAQARPHLEKWSLVRSLTHPHSEHSLVITSCSPAAVTPLGFDPTKPKKSDHPGIAASPPPCCHAAGQPSARHRAAGQARPSHWPHAGRSIRRHARLAARSVVPGDVALSSGPLRRFPGYLFHHERGLKRMLRLSTRPASLLPRLTLDRVLDRVSLRDSLETQWPTTSPGLRAMNPSIQLPQRRRLTCWQPQAHDAFSLRRIRQWLDRYGWHSLAGRLLMARRLIDSGVRMIQVNLGNNESWDTHRRLGKPQNYLLPPMDQAVSASTEDPMPAASLMTRSSSHGSEFGLRQRSPASPKPPFRAAITWACSKACCSPEQEGRTRHRCERQDRRLSRVSDPQTPENLAATIYEALGLPRETIEGLHRPGRTRFIRARPSPGWCEHRAHFFFCRN